MACSAQEVATDLGCLPNDPIGFVGRFYGIGLSLIGGVAILFLIYGGFILMTSGGDQNKLQKGKEYIYYSIAGVLLAVFGYVFIELVAKSILHIPGFG